MNYSFNNKRLVYNNKPLVPYNMINGTRYFISNNGDDNNNGLSINNAWSSISKVNSFNFSPGDQILFKAGDSFFGTISVNQSGTSTNYITYGSYGIGNNPKIYGSELITGWSNYTGNTWKAIHTTGVTQLFVNDIRMKIARYDNNGGLFDVNIVNSQTQFTSTGITSRPLDYYKNATLLIKTNLFRFDTRLITSSSGQTLTFDSALSYTLTTSASFYLCNKLEFLTEPGEWYCDSGNTVYLWKLDNSQPTNNEVRGSTLFKGIYSNNKDYINVTNLDFLHQRDYGVHFVNSDYSVIQNCNINDVELQGLAITGTYLSIKNNKIDGINYIPLSVNGNNSITTDNLILNTALYDNLQLRGMNGFSYASTFGGNNSIIKYNKVINSSYTAMSWAALNCRLEYNYFENNCLLLPDGGAIYTYTYPGNSPVASGSTVFGNIVVNCQGESGIYLDSYTEGVVVDSNIVYNSKKYSIFNNIYSRNNNIINNIIFNSYGLRVTDNGTGTTVFYNTIVNDINADSGDYLAFVNPVLSQSTFDYNLYVNRHNSTPFITTNDFITRSFSSWKLATSGDTNSTFNNTALSANEVERLIFNDTKGIKTYYLNNASNVKNNITDSVISNNFILESFKAIVLRGLNLDCILDYEDNIAPIITNFSIPTSSTGTTIDILSFVVSGDSSRYIITETSTVNLYDSGWSDTIPSAYTFTSSGQKILYAWARDAAGNISNYISGSTTVTISVDLKTNLITWYDFNQSGTTLIDESANLLSGVNYASTNTVSGHPGNAYSYAYAALRKSTINDNTLLNFSNEFTISAWVNITDLSANRLILLKLNSTLKEFSLFVNTSGQVEIRVYENSGTTYVSAKTDTNVIVSGNDYLIEVKMNSDKRVRTGLSILVNGVNKSLTYAGSIWDLTVGIVHTTAPLVIGYDDVNIVAMLGKISQLCIWNKVLSTLQSNTLYNDGSGIEYSELN